MLKVWIKREKEAELQENLRKLVTGASCLKSKGRHKYYISRKGD